MVKGKENVRSFEERKRALERFLSDEGLTNAKIGRIYDKYGPSVKGDFEAIVVSEETRETAEEINEKRKELNKEPLKIVEVPLLLAKDGLPISSSRIKKGIIDENGNII
jgi:pantetheine-phosphate adenylyltransferase